MRFPIFALALSLPLHRAGSYALFACKAAGPTSEAPKSKKSSKKNQQQKMTPDIAKREEILDEIIGALQQMLPPSALAPNEEKSLVPPNHPDVRALRADAPLSVFYHRENFFPLSYFLI